MIEPLEESKKKKIVTVYTCQNPEETKLKSKDRAFECKIEYTDE